MGLFGIDEDFDFTLEHIAAVGLSHWGVYYIITFPKTLIIAGDNVDNGKILRHLRVKERLSPTHLDVICFFQCRKIVCCALKLKFQLI